MLMYVVSMLIVSTVKEAMNVCQCIEGYSDGPDRCVDINECADPGMVCGAFATCINVELLS